MIEILSDLLHQQQSCDPVMTTLVEGACTIHLLIFTLLSIHEVFISLFALGRNQ